MLFKPEFIRLCSVVVSVCESSVNLAILASPASSPVAGSHYRKTMRHVHCFMASLAFAAAELPGRIAFEKHIAWLSYPLPLISRLIPSP